MGPDGRPCRDEARTTVGDSWTSTSDSAPTARPDRPAGDGRAARSRSGRRLYVGGKGLLLRFLYEELAAGADALAPENPLILASGAVRGDGLAATCSRLAVGCKSPATGTLLDSYVGGSFAPELKFAGYDLVVVTGRAPHPVLVLVEDDRRRVPAGGGPLLGPGDGGPRAAGTRGHGPVAKVLSTGPAGERLVPFACLSTDQYHKAGRGGAGRRDGQQEPQGRRRARHRRRHRRRYARPSRPTCSRLQSERVLTADNAWTYEEGTPFLVDARQRRRRAAHAQLATGAFDEAPAHPVRATLQGVRTKIRACTQCPLRAGRCIASATTSARVRSSRRSACAAPTAASETWRPSPPSTASATSSASTP